MARRGLTGDLSRARTPRRALGIHINATTPSGTISSEANTSPLDGSADGTGPSPSPDDPLVYERYIRQAQDGSQDELGEEISEWIPMGLVTAFSVEVKATTPSRGDQWANARMWAAEFLPDAVTMTDMLVSRSLAGSGDEEIRCTVQSTTPVIEGGETVRIRCILSERVSR